MRLSPKIDPSPASPAYARYVLAGFAYAVPFAVAGIPLGMLIDRVNRVRLLAVLLAIWSGLTALCALASGFWWLLVARIGVGVAAAPR